MAAMSARFLAGAVAAFLTMPAFATDFGVLLGNSRELLAKIQAEADRTALAARALGGTLSVPERETLQSACTAVVAAPNDAGAERRLQQRLARYRDRDPEALLRLCLDPAYRRLQSEVRTTTLSLERAQATGNALRTETELEQRLEEQRRMFDTIAAVSRTRHDTARNSISNVR